MSQALPNEFDVACQEKEVISRAMMDAVRNGSLPVGYIVAVTVVKDHNGVNHQKGILVGPKNYHVLVDYMASLARSTLVTVSAGEDL